MSEESNNDQLWCTARPVFELLLIIKRVRELHFLSGMVAVEKLLSLGTKIIAITEPLSGWREVRVRDQRTKVDWAIEMERLLTTRYRSARKVIVVCDNLNTHTKGAFYEVFPAEKARSLVRQIEFRQTPKHGSWLNIAENELSTMTRQCVTGRRFESTRPLRTETKAWSKDANKKQQGVDWQFNADHRDRRPREFTECLLLYLQILTHH